MKSRRMAEVTREGSTEVTDDETIAYPFLIWSILVGYFLSHLIPLSLVLPSPY